MAVIATGFFDGVHLGHRQVLDTLVSCAREMGQEAIVITFSRHPRMVLGQDADSLRLLNSPEEKRALLMAAGVDRVEYVDFTPQFAAMTTLEYLQFLKSRYGVGAVVIGYDNRMGSDLLAPEETATVARTIGLAPVVAECSRSPLSTSAIADPTIPLRCMVPPLMAPRVAHSPEGTAASATEQAISSTKIRTALMEGRIGDANSMLGYCYSLSGIVVHGNKIGRTLGYPTANMCVDDPLKQIPAGGVYFVQVQVGPQTYWGMTNIGKRPTVGGSELTVETHILDFSADIYGRQITIKFMQPLRAEQRFGSLEELKKNLAADESRCREILNGLQ